MRSCRHRLPLFVFLVLLLSALLLYPSLTRAAPTRQDAIHGSVTIYLFWGDGCPHCAAAKLFLQDLVDRHPGVEVKLFEVWSSPDNQELFRQMAAAQGFEPRYVPTIFVADRHWEGFSESMGATIEAVAAFCVQSGCPDVGAGLIIGEEDVAPSPTPEVAPMVDSQLSVLDAPTPPIISSPEGSGVVSPLPTASLELRPTDAVMLDPEIDSRSNTLVVPLLGAVDLGAQSLWVSTVLISFMDGFNPCSLWVLSILIALVLRTGSRKRMFVIGLVYITVTAAVYVVFIAGLFTFLTVISFLTWIQAAVSLLALFFAAVNIKDYFWYKEGVSFTIADEKKPGIYKRMRKVMNARDSLWALVGATIALGVGVSLIEFSCTAGFPVIWTNLVAAQDVSPVTFALLLLLYMIIYQIDELAIFGVAVLTLKASKLEEKHGRILKLIGGTLMLTLAVVMLIQPTLMNNLGFSLLVFGAALLLALLVLVVHRRLLPKLGIRIGTEYSR